MDTSLEALVNTGVGEQDAVPLGNGVFMSRGVANSYLVTTDEGNVVINTGLASEAPEIVARFGRVSDRPVRKIIFTQGHPDHVGGWSQLTGPDVDTIAQANHADVREYWRRLHPFYSARIDKLWRLFRDAEPTVPPEPELTTTFVDRHTFTLGGREFELYATPGGETTDALVVWLPADRTVFIGNLMGPMFGHVPNLYTIRGDKPRSALGFVHGVERVLALDPAVLVNGHAAFTDQVHIRATLELVRDATLHLRDRAIEGMNEGLDLWALMDRVTLPPELTIPQLHGKVPWIVRTIYEEYTGWFRYESTTELYSVPPSAIWPDLLDAAGGASALTARARAHAAGERPLQALHLVDIVLSQAPGDPDALAVKRDALQQLLEASGRENFSEVQWLERELAEVEAALGET